MSSATTRPMSSVTLPASCAEVLPLQDTTVSLRVTALSRASTVCSPAPHKHTEAAGCDHGHHADGWDLLGADVAWQPAGSSVVGSSRRDWAGPGSEARLSNGWQVPLPQLTEGPSERWAPPSPSPFPWAPSAEAASVGCCHGHHTAGLAGPESPFPAGAAVLLPGISMRGFLWPSWSSGGDAMEAAAAGGGLAVAEAPWEPEKPSSRRWLWCHAHHGRPAARTPPVAPAFSACGQPFISLLSSLEDASMPGG
mmetsp:Transcript_33197/g.94032  ORF Transcript_33197/g.94032 Transcript_33197/m.94032 type:complete len:252 (-) Transcript_33197:889-1644(-)